MSTTELEISFLKSQGATGNSLNELRLSYYNQLLSTNYYSVDEARQAWLRSVLSGSSSEWGDLERSFLYAKGVTHKNSVGDMWRDYYTNYGTIETATAYWKASQKSGDYLVDLTGNGHDARFGSVGAARVINKGRARYLRLPGINGNYASTPDSAALSITGDITIDAKVSLNDWTPATTAALVGKTGSTTTRSYTLFVVATTGVLSIQTSPDGSAAVSQSSSAAPVVADGATLWVRVCLDVDDGAGNKVHRFYTSSDGITWAQLGTTITTAGTTSIFDSTSILEIGSNFVGQNTAAGKIYQARIYAADLGSGSGTPVFSADFTNLADGTASFTATTGQTVTINSTSPADTNDPTYLEYTGTKYAYLPGVAGNYISTPDSAPLSITGDLDVRVKLAMDDWSPAGSQVLLSKYSNASTGYSYMLYMASPGLLTFTVSPTGSSADLVAGVATVVTGVTDGATKWVRATLDVNDGSGNRVWKFYLSDDGATWVQLGNTVTAAGTTSIFDSTAPVEVGTYLLGTGAALPGKVYRAQIRSNILDDGTGIVFDLDTSKATSPFATMTEDSSNAATVTFNRAASGKKLAVVDKTMLLLGTDDYLEVQDQANLSVGESDNLSAVIVVRTYGMAVSARFIDKRASAGWLINAAASLQPQSYLQDTVGATSVDGAGTISAGVMVNLASVIERPNNTLYINGVSNGSTTMATLVSLTQASTLRMGAGPAGNYGDMELVGAAVFRKALTPAQILQVGTELQS